MRVVSNSSPLINLAAIGRLDLLERVFGLIEAPEAVYQEVVVDGEGKPGATALLSLEWVEFTSVRDRSLVAVLRDELDAGEAEAIALAVQVDAGLLLMDERRGTAIANRLGIRTIGLVGVLIEAKTRGIIPRVRPMMDELMIHAGFWVGRRLYRRVLDAAGE